jgi:DNA-binding transcriptional LysR family regulator
VSNAQLTTCQCARNIAKVVELRRLQHLLALDDERHFGRAAERVHLSQPAFSRSIQAIEADLGLRLFERDIGDIRPTPAGDS